ncbi:hypothetical protein HYPSUDRAFT_60322, partial [Hypholoma sublateritium FD-334 SS-4]
MSSLQADNLPKKVPHAADQLVTVVPASSGRGHPASSNNSGPRRVPLSTEPESRRVAERRKEAKYGRSFTSLFVGFGTETRTLSELYRAYIEPGGDDSLRPVLRGDLKGGIGATTDLWNAFIMGVKEATDLLAEALATGHFWTPRTQAAYAMKSAMGNPHFKMLFIKVESGPLSAIYTGTKVGPWNHDTSEEALRKKEAAFANLFIWEISLLIEDLKAEFVGPMRGLGETYLTKYVIAGNIFPSKWEEGASVLRSEAQRILAMVGVDPPDAELKMILYASPCCLKLAKRLVYTAGPENVAFGLRRSSVSETKAVDREKCALPFTVLAHAATMRTQLISWLKLFAVCTAEPKTRAFLSDLDRNLSDEEVKSLGDNFRELATFGY